MAAGDLVINAASLLGAERAAPLRGVVVNVPGVDQSDVVWENGEKTDAVEDANLALLFPPEAVDQSLLDLIGRLVQINDWPTVNGVPGSTPKSPAASGIVRGAYGAGLIGSAQPANGFLEVEVFGGRGVILVQATPNPPGPVTVLGRRSVY